MGRERRSWSGADRGRSVFAEATVDVFHRGTDQEAVGGVWQDTPLATKYSWWHRSSQVEARRESRGARHRSISGRQRAPPSPPAPPQGGNAPGNDTHLPSTHSTLQLCSQDASGSMHTWPSSTHAIPGADRRSLGQSGKVPPVPPSPLMPPLAPAVPPSVPLPLVPPSAAIPPLPPVLTSSPVESSVHAPTRPSPPTKPATHHVLSVCMVNTLQGTCRAAQPLMPKPEDRSTGHDSNSEKLMRRVLILPNCRGALRRK